MNMFPNRVGRMILDSVLDPELYTNPTPDLLVRSYTDNDANFRAFTDQCEAAGPAQCALADANATRPYLMGRLQVSLRSVATSLLLVPGGNDVVRISATGVRQRIFGAMYEPYASWRPLAKDLAAMMAGTYQAPPTNASCSGSCNASGCRWRWWSMSTVGWRVW